MIAGYAIHGHAIVSADDMIADADNNMPASLQCEADWRRFQNALDEAVVTVLGRRSHQRHPNHARRPRLVLSSSVSGLMRRRDAWWWNPVDVPLTEALARSTPGPGIVAVPGGRQAFDLFLESGYDEFHLARATRAQLPGGVPLFSAVSNGLSAAESLQRSGLAASQSEALDADAGVELTIWRREPH